MDIIKYTMSDAAIPEQLRLYKSMIIDEEEMPDYRLTLIPSRVPLGAIKISVLDSENKLWYSKDGKLLRGSLFGGASEDISEITENKKTDILFCDNDKLWILCGEEVFCVPFKPAPEPKAFGAQPTQKRPYYYDLDDARVTAEVKKALEKSKSFESDGILDAIGSVTAVCPDENGGRFVALKDGVMHFSPAADFDRRSIELYHGGRFIFCDDPSVSAVAWTGEGLWIENACGYVFIKHYRLSLREKERHFDRLAWELHSVRGSLCDTSYKTEDYGNNDKLEQTIRYSTNNDALWSVFHSIGDCLKYSYLIKNGENEEAQATREKIISVTKNVLLQAHVHSLGNGFICRSYVSRRDSVFIKDGALATDGLWFSKDGVNADGGRYAEIVDTNRARNLYIDHEEGRDFTLTDEVKERLHTTSDVPVSDDFRLSAPITAEVPPLLAELYKKADPYHPEKYPASEDNDLFFKADTSSEEAIAAFVQYYFSWKHLFSVCDDAEVRELRELICDTAAASINHIISNGYILRDLHGRPTQWGKWFADYFVKWDDIKQPWRHPRYAFMDAPLNSAEIMCMFKVCLYILEGNKKHEDTYNLVFAEYEKMFTLDIDPNINGAGYSKHLGLYRENLAYTAKIIAGLDNYTLSINYSDETLAIISFWPLLELEENSERHDIISAGLDEWWDNMSREGNPIYTFAYAAMNPEKNIDLSNAVDNLNRLPLYPNQLPVTNSERNDLLMLFTKEGLQSNTLLPIDERRMHKFNTSPFKVDHPGRENALKNGLYTEGSLFSGNIFTWPYWTAKYYDLVELD